MPALFTHGILPYMSIEEIDSSEFHSFIVRYTISESSLTTFPFLSYAIAEKLSCSLSMIRTIVAVVAIFATGINFLSMSAFINVDLPELMVATTFTSKSWFFDFLNASMMELSRNFSIGPFCMSIKIRFTSCSTSSTEGFFVKSNDAEMSFASEMAACKSSKSVSKPMNSIWKFLSRLSSTNISAMLFAHSCRRIFPKFNRLLGFGVFPSIKTLVLIK